MTKDLHPRLGSGVLREAWRIGSKVPLNIYDGDRPVCQCHTVADARLIVKAVNALLSLSSPIEAALPEECLWAAENMDWQQVILNGGPPCFNLGEDGHFCGRAQRWDGHDSIHKFISLAGLLAAQSGQIDAQASSEIREAGEELAQAFALFEGTLGKNWMNTARAQALVALDRWRALAPSRQGAGT